MQKNLTKRNPKRRKFFSKSGRRSHQTRRPISRPLSIEPLESRLLLATLQTGFSETVVASSLSSATAMELSPDGKLFVAEQGGTMEVWQNGSQLQNNFFANTPLNTQTVSERGLLGVTFDPNYATNRYIYAYYTTTAADGHNRVSRFTANATGDLALAGSEDVIMELDPHSAGNHNGGALRFGPDGMLYIATGDNAIGSTSQSLTNRHGKMLRIDLSGDDFPSDDDQDYKIPVDQPTTFDGISGSTTGINQSIWAVGLRNPFTFAIQPGTGRIFINDVGQGMWEEINEGGAGLNFGWPSTEGYFNQATFPDFTQPFFAYDHGSAQPNGCAIAGGAFYNPTINQFPSEYQGDYFFADFCENRIWHIDLTTNEVNEFASNVASPVDLRVDDAGNLYYLARGTGQVFQVSLTNLPPAITNQPDSQTITYGDPVTFEVGASGAEPLTYQWQRAENGTSTFTDIAGEVGTSYTLANVQSSDDGDQFRVVVTDTFSNSTTSDIAILTATSNNAPTATITLTGGLRDGKWDAGTPVSFSGTGTDLEDGTLPASSFSWQIDYLSTINGGDSDNDGVPGITRPFLTPGDIGQVTNSVFTPATTGPYTLTDVAHVITLTVTDSQGRTDVDQVTIDPNTASITLETNPVGLQVTVDGQPFTSPYSFDSVVGFERPIGAEANQTLAGTIYEFASWSDGGAATHTIDTPATDTTYTATFTPGGFAVNINFQDTTSQGYTDYLADTGLPFGDQGNGLSYGWDIDITAGARNRNNGASPDERYDTLNHMQSTGDRTWEIAVPNGTYELLVVAGDPSFSDQVNNLNIEGTVVSDPDGPDNFDEFNTVVEVTDGRLTIQPATGASNAKIAFLELSTQTPPDDAADFDQDGTIDGYDFLAWQRGFGIQSPNATKSDGDADNDLAVDGEDLVIWENQYGWTEPLASTSAETSAAVNSNTELPLTSSDLGSLAQAFELSQSTPKQQPEQLEDESYFGETPSDLAFAIADTTPSVSATLELDTPKTNSAEIDKGESPWLSDELLERVFG